MFFILPLLIVSLLLESCKCQIISTGSTTSCGRKCLKIFLGSSAVFPFIIRCFFFNIGLLYLLLCLGFGNLQMTSCS